MSADLIITILALIAIWFSAETILRAVDSVSHKLNLSTFAVSFVVLGILTSLPEISVGVNALFEDAPEIFTGDLIGASLVLFILVIPLLAILGNGVKLSNHLSSGKLLFALVTVGLPGVFITDGQLTSWEAVALIVLYIGSVVVIEKQKGILQQLRNRLVCDKRDYLVMGIQVITAAVILFYAGAVLVDKTVLVAHVLGVSPYLVSLLGLSVGTNTPELTLAVRAVMLGKKDVAIGDYIGSASANTLILGVLALINGGVSVSNHFFQTMLFTVLGLGFFYYFTRSKNDVSRTEGIALLFLYLSFILAEI